MGMGMSGERFAGVYVRAKIVAADAGCALCCKDELARTRQTSFEPVRYKLLFHSCLTLETRLPPRLKHGFCKSVEGKRLSVHTSVLQTVTINYKHFVQSLHTIFL
jgi:hypothetical protein